MIDGKEEVAVETVLGSYGSCGKDTEGVSGKTTVVIWEDERR
jgi:hypothetical protein